MPFDTHCDTMLVGSIVIMASRLFSTGGAWGIITCPLPGRLAAAFKSALSCVSALMVERSCMRGRMVLFFHPQIKKNIPGASEPGAVSDLLVDISTKMDKDYALAYLSCSDKSEFVDVLASRRRAEFRTRFSG